MIQIDEPPAKPFCASCMEQLVWLYSATKQAWVAFIACRCGSRYSLHPHPCRHAQDPRVWRELPRGDPPSETYLEIKAKIASREMSSGEEDPDSVRP